MAKISFDINNQMTIEINQERHDGTIYVTKLSDKGTMEDSYNIEAGDFITMLNWYNHQKRSGNESLYYE